MQTIKTEAHEFSIQATSEGFLVSYRPINPKTGKAWQARRFVTDLASIDNRYYPTLPQARLAIMRKKSKLQAA